MAKEEILQPLLWDDQGLVPTQQQQTSIEQQTKSLNTATTLPSSKSIDTKTQVNRKTLPSIYSRTVQAEATHVPRSVLQAEYTTVSNDDLIGGCACSWTFPSWSTPPGGDRQKSRRRRALCISAVIVGTIFSIVATICHFSGPFDIIRSCSNATFHTLRLSVGRQILLQVYQRNVDGLSYKKQTPPVLLSIIMGREIPQHVPYLIKYTADGSTLSVEFDKFASLTIEHSLQDSEYSPQSECYNISWENKGAPGCSFEDALVLGSAHWYGGAPIHKQKWPIEQWDKPLQPFITGDAYHGNYGGVQARYWLSSQGVGVHVDWDVPLFLAVNHKNDGLLRLSSKCCTPYTHLWHTKPAFHYTVCHSRDANMKDVHQHMANKFLPKPEGLPDERLFNETIWSTAAKYKNKIDQEKVLEFGEEIYKYGFAPSQLELDDDWILHYGDNDFDKNKFPDPQSMIEKLKQMGFRVVLGTHPFASPLSNSFYEGMSKGYWVENWLIALPALIMWGDGIGSLLDVTNPNAVEWHTSHLTQLKAKYGVHSFKFNDGEGAWLPTWHHTHQNIHNPNEYTRMYAQMAYQWDPHGRSQQLLSGIGTQDLPIFTRVSDKLSTWGYDNGIKSIIPNILTFGIIGYPFVMPNVIGGNSFTSGSSVPERELYIRWIELATFLPSMQFSVPPWHYDDEVVSITKQMYALHKAFSPLYIALAREATRSGAQIVRPLWWLCPKDPECQIIDTQFLLGDTVLVAPVLEKGARQRDIYLPPGLWIDQLYGKIYKGPEWLREFPAGLHQLPHFIRKE